MHLPKKITNFSAPPVPARNIIPAVFGTPEEYSPFSVPESILTTDSLHYTNGGGNNTNFFKVSNIAKFLKDHRKVLKSIPSMFSTDNKSK